MGVRTTETTVTFSHPFTSSAVEGIQPAGTYRLVVDEEELQGLSFRAFRRTATLLQLPAVAVSDRGYRVVPVDAAELEAALAADGAQPSAR